MQKRSISFFLLALLPSFPFRHRVSRHWNWENLPWVTVTFRRLLCEKLRAALLWQSLPSPPPPPPTDLKAWHSPALPRNPRVPMWIIHVWSFEASSTGLWQGLRRWHVARSPPKWASFLKSKVNLMCKFPSACLSSRFCGDGFLTCFRKLPLGKLLWPNTLNSSKETSRGWALTEGCKNPDSQKRRGRKAHI